MQQVSAQGPAHSEAPPSDGESESEVNFDSEEELDIAGLLPCSDNKDEGEYIHTSTTVQCNAVQYHSHLQLPVFIRVSIVYVVHMCMYFKSTVN